MRNYFKYQGIINSNKSIDRIIDDFANIGNSKNLITVNLLNQTCMPKRLTTFVSWAIAASYYLIYKKLSACSVALAKM